MRSCSPIPTIEAIYNPLPNELHVPWTISALEAGKHVLCEKPIALDADEAAALIAARDASGKLVAEAFMVRFHPQWRRAREIVRSGAIGDVGAIQTLFTYRLLDADNMRNQPPGGGGLYDIGCYAILTARYIFGAEPTRVAARARHRSRIRHRPAGQRDDRVSRRPASDLHHRDAARRRISASPIAGTAGRIEVAIPFNAPIDRPTRIIDRQRRRSRRRRRAGRGIPVCDQYTLQGDAFSRAVRGEAPLEFPIEDAIANMRVIDAAFRSARSGGLGEAVAGAQQPIDAGARGP